MKRPISKLTLLAAPVVLAACSVSPEAMLDRAETALAENRYGDARLDLATLLKERPDDPQLLLLYARTQLQLGDGDGALSTLERLVATGVNVSDLAHMRAEATLLSGRFADALALAATLDDAEGARIAALAHIGLGDPEKAWQAFEEGLTRSGETHRLKADFALLALQARDVERALMLAEQAREEKPDGLDPLLASARIAVALGQVETALAHFERAAQFYPENRAAMLGQVAMLAEMGQSDEARKHLAELAAWAPDEAEVIFLQARFAADDGDWSAVRDLLQGTQSSASIAQQVLYARALVELGLQEQAIAQLTGLVRREPDAEAARRILARAQLDSGQAEQAFATIAPLANSPEGTPADLAFYAKAAQVSGNDGALAGALAKAPPAERVATMLADADKALRDKRWRAAIASYEQLRAWTGDSNALVLNNLAYARSQAGDKAQALSIAEKAHALVPANASIKDTLGWLLVETGEDRIRGIMLLEEAAALAPDNATIADHLAQAKGQ